MKVICKIKLKLMNSKRVIIALALGAEWLKPIRPLDPG